MELVLAEVLSMTSIVWAEQAQKIKQMLKLSGHMPLSPV